MFADPLLAGELPGDQELVEIAEAAPNAAAAVIKLFRAYREQAERLSDLSELLAREGHATALSGARLPIDEVREVFERRPNHFAGIEEEAEAFTAVLDPGDDLFGALKAWLKREHGIVVKVLPVAHHAQLAPPLRPPLAAPVPVRAAVALRPVARGGDGGLPDPHAVAVAAEIQALKLSSDEARRLARFELGRYAAHALMMPYQAFHSAAQRARYDIDVLRSRFGVSFEQAANRLTMLQRPGASGVPFFMLEVDNAGNRFRRAGAQGFPQSRFGGGCPKLPVHAAFAQPGQIFVEAVEMPDGAEFLCVARTLEGPQGAFNERPRRTAHPARLRHRLPRRDRLWRGASGVAAGGKPGRSPRRRSVRPAGSASAPAACRAPSRR